jgi:hypothetical protein
MKMQKTNLFLFFWNSPKLRICFFLISSFPLIGPKPTDRGPKLGFEIDVYLLALSSHRLELMLSDVIDHPI